ncbi:hypothetical protein [Aggregatibacter actinomycetemcomitans]|uniref:hypothetical protein n=1 Tax=Aggregatibacter actinomycetemcomitans TaxID=714 RepID=UPI00022AE09F|nr:hypothetical protein [Aggregatibacter actinomycetemcomitans]KOE63913.1 hypothetical protein SCC393_0311175 [Aggregatibacter actinomycetemcomitans serotype e str. SCC393]KOE67395.1 hypothetical protein A160_0201870 [Aggregatibacter actinomycetemcomitans serotype e str. A160]KYK78352.1 hypothetical protein SA2876_04255 [Aggregatibacter actinomycetemcomitans serotype e str. SA2876]
MKNLENIIIEEMEKHHPNAVSDAEFWAKLEETYGEFELNNVVMSLYKRGVIGFMPHQKKGFPIQPPASPYKIVHRAMTLRKR